MSKDEYILEMKQYAKDNEVPIIEDEGLEVLLEIVNSVKPKSILELGTAIGYSASLMHLNTNAQITTIERVEEMYNQAKINVHELGLEENINLIFSDALDVDETRLGKFDLIYFDAAKAQNKNFLKKYENNLNEGGLIVIDNLLFHGWVAMKQEEIKSRNLRQMVRKINDFIDYVTESPRYDFRIYEKGDGIGIIKINKEYNE